MKKILLLALALGFSATGLLAEQSAEVKLPAPAAPEASTAAPSDHASAPAGKKHGKHHKKGHKKHAHRKQKHRAT